MSSLRKAGLALGVTALAAAACLYTAPEPAVGVDEQMRVDLVENLARAHGPLRVRRPGRALAVPPEKALEYVLQELDNKHLVLH